MEHWPRFSPYKLCRENLEMWLMEHLTINTTFKYASIQTFHLKKVFKLVVAKIIYAIFKNYSLVTLSSIGMQETLVVLPQGRKAVCTGHSMHATPPSL